MFEEDDEKMPIQPLVIIACGWIALAIGAWGLLSSTVAFYSAAGTALGFTIPNDIHCVRDYFGSSTVTMPTYFLLVFRILISAGVLASCTWLLKLEARGSRLLQLFFSADVLAFLVIVLSWHILQVHPRYEVVMLELILTILRIGVIVTLAHPSLAGTLRQRVVPQSEKDF